MQFHMFTPYFGSATVAADGLVCVFDAERAINASVYGGETEFSSSQACIQIFRCHDERTKRIVTEESADLFLSVAEVYYISTIGAK